MAQSPPETLRIPGSPALNLLRWSSKGDPLLLLHGLGGNAWWWMMAAPLLADSYHVVGLDFRGHGDSDWSATGQYGLGDFVKDVDCARQFLGWGRMALCGHSMGARVALSYAYQKADRLSHLIAIDFVPEFAPSSQRTYAMAGHLDQPMYSSLEDILPRFRLRPRQNTISKARMEELAHHCIRKVDGGYTWKFDWRCFGLAYDSAWRMLSDIRIPTLIIRGAQSTLMKKEVYDEVVRAIPGAAGHEIDRAYHHVPLDAPDALSTRLRDFLKFGN